MIEGWRSEFLHLLLWLSGGWVLGLIFGHPLWGLIGGLIVYLCWLLIALKRIVRWLSKGAVGAPPNVRGIAERIVDLVYQRQRRNLKRRQRFDE